MMPTSDRAFSIQAGYTLMEMLIVVAIIGILAAITIPIYKQYLQDAQRSSCLSEAKNYSNKVFYELNDQDDSSLPVAPVISTCESITDAKGWTLDTQQKIIAVAKSPSNARIECDIPNGSPCRIMP